MVSIGCGAYHSLRGAIDISGKSSGGDPDLLVCGHTFDCYLRAVKKVNDHIDRHVLTESKIKHGIVKVHRAIGEQQRAMRLRYPTAQCSCMQDRSMSDADSTESPSKYRRCRISRFSRIHRR